MRVQTDMRVLGYLGRALSHELSAVQQYSTHAGLAEIWGLPDVARHFHDEARGEQEHAATLTKRMLELGAMPNRSQLAPTEAGPSLLHLLEADKRLELRAVELYHEAAHYCGSIGASADQQLFSTLLHEELEHTRELNGWLERLRPQYQAAQPSPLPAGEGVTEPSPQPSSMGRGNQFERRRRSF